MNDLAVIDRFTNVFSRYIDSGFGLVNGEVAFLSATLVVIDITLAGLWWAMDRGQSEVMARLIKKVLYVGVFAFILGNFNWLAGILFRSFSSLGLMASGSSLTAAEFLQPGRLAQVGVDTAAPLLSRVGELSGITKVFANLETIVVLLLAWFIVVLSFFVLSIQLFVTLIEFKLTTLAARAGAFCLVGKDSVFGRKGFGQRHFGGHQGAGARGHRGHQHTGLQRLPYRDRPRADAGPGCRRDAGLAGHVGLGHLWSRNRDRIGVRRAAIGRGGGGRHGIGCGWRSSGRCRRWRRCRGRCGAYGGRRRARGYIHGLGRAQGLCGGRELFR